LGVCEPVFLDFEDGTLHDQAALVQALEELIRRFRPEIIMAPFITDSHPDHIATSQALVSVKETLLHDARLFLYQVHSHIPDRLLNRYVGLTQDEQKAKEAVLQLYVSQDMGDTLTRSKYLLFSTVAPQIRKQPGIKSVEPFAMLGCAELRELYESWNLQELTSQLKSTNYSAYSFRHYLNNRKILDGPFKGSLSV
jgi:hypothetical protein